MAEYEYLAYIKDGPMAVIEIFGPEKKKRNLERLSVELGQVCEDIGFDISIRAVLLQGTDREALNLQEGLDHQIVSHPKKKKLRTWFLAKAVGGQVAQARIGQQQ